MDNAAEVISSRLAKENGFTKLLVLTKELKVKLFQKASRQGGVSRKNSRKKNLGLIIPKISSLERSSTFQMSKLNCGWLVLVVGWFCCFLEANEPCRLHFRPSHSTNPNPTTNR